MQFSENQSHITYQEATDYLFNQLPVFQVQGPGAYKPGLDTTLQLSEAFGNPHKQFKFIHIAGTNGKGSTAHSLAAILQKAGYKTALFTSPHLVDFRERIRINGEMIPQGEVIDFLERFWAKKLELNPTFFELTTIMAMDWFRREGVDIAVMEVGLGGRLDSTNIITPEISVITNISLDHTALLGNTVEEIAAEKAGIIKPGVPVAVGEAEGGVRAVFEKKAAESASLISLPDVDAEVKDIAFLPDYLGIRLETKSFGEITYSLSGDCQPKNADTVLRAVKILKSKGWEISDKAIKAGMADVQGITGLMGRWMKISERPKIFCDTGHNPGGWEYLSERLAKMSNEDPKKKLTIVIGFVGDKDVSSILQMLPSNADYIFTQPSVPRRLEVKKLAENASKIGLQGQTAETVLEAYQKAINQSGADDYIFVGGSSFVVADLLTGLNSDS